MVMSTGSWRHSAASGLPSSTRAEGVLRLVRCPIPKPRSLKRLMIGTRPRVRK